MFSFRSIFTAAVAFATLASAIPVGPNLPTPNPSDLLGTVTSTTSGNAVGSLVNPGGLGKRGEAKYPGDIVNSCKHGVDPIILEIKAIIAVKDFDHAKVTSLIGEIVVLLKVAILDLKATVAAKLALDLLLTIDGVVCTVAELARVVFALLEVVVVVLAIVLKLVLTVDVTLARLLFSVGILLGEIVTLVLGLVAGLDIELAILVKAIVVHLDVLHCTQILALLRLKA